MRNYRGCAMPTNTRLAVALHILSGLAYRATSGKSGATSAELAKSVNTNPVVVRRILGELAKAGLVTSTGGRGGGYELARDPARIRLDAVLVAIEPEGLFSVHENPANRACTVSCGIKPALGQLFERADHALRDHLRGTTLADFLRRVESAG